MNDIWNKTYRVFGITAGDAEVRAITAVSFHALTCEPVAVCNLDIDIRSGRTATSVSVDITADNLDQLAARLNEAAQRAREMTALAAQLKHNSFLLSAAMPILRPAQRSLPLRRPFSHASQPDHAKHQTPITHPGALRRVRHHSPGREQGDRVGRLARLQDLPAAIKSRRHRCCTRHAKRLLDGW